MSCGVQSPLCFSSSWASALLLARHQVATSSCHAMRHCWYISVQCCASAHEDYWRYKGSSLERKVTVNAQTITPPFPLPPRLASLVSCGAGKECRLVALPALSPILCVTSCLRAGGGLTATVWRHRCERQLGSAFAAADSCGSVTGLPAFLYRAVCAPPLMAEFFGRLKSIPQHLV